jgi:hypothetical protein
MFETVYSRVVCHDGWFGTDVFECNGAQCVPWPDLYHSSMLKIGSDGSIEFDLSA